MPKFLADEDLNNRIVRGLRRLSLEIDIARVHEVGLIGVDDVEVLEWAAGEGRILLTHDVATMIAFGYDRIKNEKEFPGMIAVSQNAPIGRVIEDIAKIVENENIDLSGRVIFIPIK